MKAKWSGLLSYWVLRQTPSVLRWPDRGAAGLNRWVRGEVGGVAEECLGAAAGGGKLQQSTAGTGCERAAHPAATSLTNSYESHSHQERETGGRSKTNPILSNPLHLSQQSLPFLLWLLQIYLGLKLFSFTLCQPSQLWEVTGNKWEVRRGWEEHLCDSSAVRVLTNQQELVKSIGKCQFEASPDEILIVSCTNELQSTQTRSTEIYLDSDIRSGKCKIRCTFSKVHFEFSFNQYVMICSY